jgi:transposase
MAFDSHQANERGHRQTKTIQAADKSSHAAPPALAFQKLPASKTSPPRPLVRLTEAQRRELLSYTRARTSPHRLVVRSRIVLLAADGLAPAAIAKRLHLTTATVRLWCVRFLQAGTATLHRDAPGRGRRPGMTRDLVLAVLRGMRHQPRGAVWTARTLASHSSTSASTVCRIWKRYGIGPSSPATQIDGLLDQLISETRDRLD